MSSVPCSFESTSTLALGQTLSQYLPMSLYVLSRYEKLVNINSCSDESFEYVNLIREKVALSIDIISVNPMMI